MRKLATAAAVSLALASGGAFGLGLGEIEMRSALNQPMNAEIPLTSVQAGELDGMIVQLASPEAFARAGIERSPVLTDLRFTVDRSSGTPVIRISSQRPVIEPFLNFLLEVDWPQGRMVREYTVLLDPPVFMTPTATERSTRTEQPAVVQQGGESLVVPTPIQRSTDGGESVDLGSLALDGSTIEGAADAGEIVSLEAVSDDTLLGTAPSVAADDGEIISLTDLSAPNSAALEEREQFLAEQQARLDNITVELADSVEVSDTEVIGTAASNAADDSTIVSLDGAGEDASTIVSLDELGEDASTIVALDELSDEAGASDTAPELTRREVQVGQGDTLYEIAQDAAGDRVTVQQMMMALLAANESAFINGNINLVRAGAILRIPETDSAARLTQAQALAAISQQNQLWQDYRNSLSGGGTRIASGTGSASSDTPAAETTETLETAALDPELASDEAADGLSPEARAILENARNELLNRDELRIVADSSPTSTSASATADETADSDAARLGEVNLKLQLAREELSATRLQAEELADQASELQGTTENLDALVSLRQNEIAQLEAQLAEAREAEARAAAEVAEGDDTVADTADQTLADADDAVTADGDELAAVADDTLEAAADTASETAEAVADGAGELAADAGDALAQAGDAVSDSVSDAGDTAAAAADEAEDNVNALTAAGEELAQVELIEDTDAAAEPVAEAPTPTLNNTWYEDFINDPKRMAIAGIGAVGLLGVLGTLLFRRRRQDDELLAVDEAEFTAEEMAAMETGSDDKPELSTGAGVAAAGVAAAGAVAASSDQGSDDVIAMPADPQVDAATMQAAISEAGSQDDTISEVDVYLAYGLHGQAEELLTKATERDPDNQEYASKLLQTYHAQGNAAGFQETAEHFHARFGGEQNPEWPAIAAMGADLQPGNALFSAAHATVDRVGSGHSDGKALDDDDFLASSDSASSSISRDFDAQGATAEFDDVDESALMDQSLDPAFAFDEDDLEATGDFSEISDALAEEAGATADSVTATAADDTDDDGSIDFPGITDAAASVGDATDDLANSLDESIGDTARAAQADADALAGQLSDAGEDLTSELSADMTAGEQGLSPDELDRVASVDDLTLDLDQLSGDLELDGADLMNSDLSDLDLPDLTAENDLLLDSDSDNSDEMETMLDLAKAYIDMGDKDSASSALDEIVKSGNAEQKTEAETLLRKIS